MAHKKDSDTLDIDLDEFFGDLDTNNSSDPHPNLQPFVDADDEITLEVCMHLNKRWTVQGVNLKYWYCPDCKKEVKNCLPPKTVGDVN